MLSPAPDGQPPDPPVPTLAQLFLGFSGVAIVGFGGVMPWAHRMLVEKKQWLTPDEFVQAVAVAQFLPGANILNMAVAIGRHFRGAGGALFAALGLMAAPFVIVTLLAALYLRYGEIAAVHNGLAGVAAGASGLMISMALKMAEPLARSRAPMPIVFAVLAAVGIAVIGLPLLLVLAVIAPLSIAYAWWKLR